MARERCRHLICSCDARPEDEGYCSPECADASPSDERCNCGHAGCADADSSADR